MRGRVLPWEKKKCGIHIGGNYWEGRWGVGDRSGGGEHSQGTPASLHCGGRRERIRWSFSLPHCSLISSWPCSEKMLDVQWHGLGKTEDPGSKESCLLPITCSLFQQTQEDSTDPYPVDAQLSHLRIAHIVEELEDQQWSRDFLDAGDIKMNSRIASPRWWARALRQNQGPCPVQIMYAWHVHAVSFIFRPCSFLISSLFHSTGNLRSRNTQQHKCELNCLRKGKPWQHKAYCVHL